MSILVVGSVAFDTLKTPYGEREKIIGGSATYFSLAASYFTTPRVIGVVGDGPGMVKDYPLGTRELRAPETSRPRCRASNR